MIRVKDVVAGAAFFVLFVFTLPIIVMASLGSVCAALVDWTCDGFELIETWRRR